MGIKGRKRRERLRQEKLAAQRGDGDSAGHLSGEDDGDMGDDTFFHEIDSGAGGMELLPPGVGPALVAGPDGVPLKMKKSEAYNIRDQDYLERLKEEHQGRRSSHLRRKVKEQDPEESAAAAEQFLRQVDTSEIKHLLEPTGDSRQRCAVDTGARLSHPLLGLDDSLVHALATCGFTRMTPIQQRAIPLALSGADILGQAKTGSGKTLAFCIPVLHSAIRSSAGARKLFVALMVAPTKELCVQTNNILGNILAQLPPQASTKSLLITGGTKVLEERKKLADCSIVVGTPGRVLDHIRHSQAAWHYRTAQFLVLDEADRMLADGFARDLDAIVAAMPKNRQTFLFSATNTKSVHELARLSLAKTPLFVSARGDAPTYVDHDAQHLLPPPPYTEFGDDEDEEEGGEGEEEEEETDDDASSNNEAEAVVGRKRARGKRENRRPATGDEEDIPSALRQFCAIVPFADRLRALYVFVKRVARTAKAMVFCSTVASAIFHCQMMGSVGFHDEVLMLHGHMKHRQRLATFEAFQKWPSGVVFCTDVAARGLDIPNVDWILQLDPPLDPTEYVHRIGRTARAGSVGSALIFLAPEEANFVPYLSRFGISMEKYPMPPQLPDIQMKLEHVLQVDSVVAKSAISAFRAYVGAYQSHVLKETFDVHRVDLEELAASFALSEAPQVSLPKNSAEEKQQEYVKGKLKSLNKQKVAAIRHYQEEKTRTQWTADGRFVGVHKPQLR